MIFLRPKRLEKKTSDAREPSLYRSICTSIISTLLKHITGLGAVNRRSFLLMKPIVKLQQGGGRMSKRMRPFSMGCSLTRRGLRSLPKRFI